MKKPSNVSNGNDNEVYRYALIFDIIREQCAQEVNQVLA